MKRDDLVVDDGNGHMTIALVLAIGPRVVDVIEQCGGIDCCPFRVPSATELSSVFQRDHAYAQRVREMLAKEAAKARAERRGGARINRGHVWRR